MLLPSSQVSPASTIPSPHTAVVSHASPVHASYCGCPVSEPVVESGWLNVTVGASSWGEIPPPSAVKTDCPSPAPPPQPITRTTTLKTARRADLRSTRILLESAALRANMHAARTTLHLADYAFSLLRASRFIEVFSLAPLTHMLALARACSRSRALRRACARMRANAPFASSFGNSPVASLVSLAMNAREGTMTVNERGQEAVDDEGALVVEVTLSWCAWCARCASGHASVPDPMFWGGFRGGERNVLAVEHV